MHGFEYIWLTFAVIGPAQALGQGQYYSGQGYFNNSCPISQCATDCGIGMYRSGCANAFAGACTACTGLVAGNSWVTQGYLNNSCQQVGPTVVTVLVTTPPYIPTTSSKASTTGVQSTSLKLSTTSQQSTPSTTSQQSTPSTTSQPSTPSTTAQPSIQSTIAQQSAQPTPKLSVQPTTPRLSTAAQPTTPKPSTARLTTNRLSATPAPTTTESTNLGTAVDTTDAATTAITTSTPSKPDNTTSYAVQFMMSVPVVGTLNSTQYMQTVSTLALSLCGVCTPIDSLTLQCPYCQIHNDISYSNARRLLASTATITTTIHVLDPITASDLVTILNTTASKQAISLILGPHVVYIQSPFMLMLESILTDASGPSIALIIGCAAGGVVLIAAGVTVFIVLHNRASSKANAQFNWNMGSSTIASKLSEDGKLMGRKSVPVYPGERRHGLNEHVRRPELIYRLKD